MNTKLSVITINLNNAEGLRKTLRSVIEQTFSEFEYIVIDGGSTDDSIKIIEETVGDLRKSQNNGDLKFDWISESDSGIYNAMNKGILRSCGEYCFFLNSGDWLVSPDIFRNIFLEPCNQDFLFGNMYICEKGRVVEKSIPSSSITFMDLYLSKIKHQACFIKRSMFDKYGLYKESNKIVSDWELLIRAIGLQNATYRYFNEFITFFDNSGISNNSHEIRIEERNRILEESIPPKVLADYRLYEKHEFLKPAFKFKLTYLALRFISKLAKEFDKLRSGR